MIGVMYLFLAFSCDRGIVPLDACYDRGVVLFVGRMLR